MSPLGSLSARVHSLILFFLGMLSQLTVNPLTDSLATPTYTLCRLFQLLWFKVSSLYLPLQCDLLTQMYLSSAILTSEYCHYIWHNIKCMELMNRPVFVHRLYCGSCCVDVHRCF